VAVPAVEELSVKERGERMPVVEGLMVRDVALVPVPEEVVTETVPDVAPEGTVKDSEVSDTTLKVEAFVPFTETTVAPVKPEPVSVTVELMVALVGEILVITGAVAPAVTVGAGATPLETIHPEEGMVLMLLPGLL